MRPSSRRAHKESKRERATGLDPDDEAARWLAEHDAKPGPAPPKSASTSRELHRF